MSFIILGLIGLIALSIFLTIYIQKKNNKYTKKRSLKILYITLKILSVTLFILYMFRLFQVDVIDSTYKLSQILISRTHTTLGEDDSSTITSYLFGPGLMSGTSVAFLMFLRWFTVVIVAVNIIASFVPNKSFKNISAFIGIFIGILNIVFFIPNLIGFVGLDYNIFGFRSIQFAMEIVIMMTISGLGLYRKFLENDFKNMKQQIGRMFLIFAAILLFFFPEGMLTVFFGDIGQKTTDFSISHRIILYIIILSMVASYFVLKDQPMQNKKLFFITLAFAGVFQFFYNKTIFMGIGGLPLHLCNTAIILMFIAVVFDLKGVFYFNYFVNVLGALCAMLMPNTSGDAFTMQTMIFWYNHGIDFIFPVLGVALGVWKRPNMKMMIKAMTIFTIYFVIVMVFNAWFNGIKIRDGLSPNIDYFFLYGDIINDKFPFLLNLQYGHVLEFNVNGQIWRFFWIYQIIIYVSFIALMFGTWYVYDAGYKIEDSLKDLHKKLKKQKMDMIGINKERQAIMKKGINTIQEKEKENDNVSVEISHFSKRYGSSPEKSVDDFNVTVKKGQVYGFLGHNGAGKSTTIKSMVGIQSITEGTIKICGHDIQKEPLAAKLNLGYVSDNHAVYEKLTGREYVNYVADLYMVSKEDRDIRIDKYLKMFELEDAFDREIKSYSHGMKQKIVVIASLIHNPKVWVLDEPLTGLDPSSSYQIKECMRQHADNGNVVFFSSHVIEIVEKICDRIVIIAHGKKKGEFDVKELREHGIALEEMYLKYVYKNSDDKEITFEQILKEMKND